MHLQIFEETSENWHGRKIPQIRQCDFNSSGADNLRTRLKNIAKGTTDPRIEFYLPEQLLWVISQVQTQILIKHLQNVDLASTSKSQPKPFRQNLNLKILTKSNQNLDQEWNFIATTKHQQQNDYQTSASKSCQLLLCWVHLTKVTMHWPSSFC